MNIQTHINMRMVAAVICLVGVVISSSGLAGNTIAAPAQPEEPNASTPYLVKDIYPGVHFGLPESLSIAALGSQVFFNATSPGFGEELWVSDGTEAGTEQVKDIYAGNSGSDPGSLKVFNGRVYFKAQTAAEGAELWVSDGTEIGTHLVRDIIPGPGNSLPARLTVMGDWLYFVASSTGFGEELWRTDGTELNTTLVKDINPLAGNSQTSNLVVMNDVLYFRADNGTDGVELWRSDGTAAGTQMVRNIHPSGSSTPMNLTVLNGVLYFSADDGVHGRELWRSDGSEAGTSLVKDIFPGGVESLPDNLAASGDTLFFSASDELHGREIWKSDGSEAGTVMVTEINPGTVFFPPNGLTWVGEELFFAVGTEAQGKELWRSDGSAAGTWQIKDINAGIGSSNPVDFQPASLAIVFRANDGVHGTELWRSNGFEDGTAMLADIFPGASGGNPHHFTLAGERLFFAADDGVHGAELWALEMTNAAPAADAGGPYFGVEGAAILLSPVMSDPDGDTVSAFWQVDSEDCSFDDPFSATASLTCGNNGTYTLTLTATDIWGLQAVDTATVTLTNAPPVVESITRTGVGANFEITIEAGFSDPGTADTHNAQVDWGDGSPVEAAVVDPATRTVSASHHYTAHGSYPVTVSVTDSDGASGELTQVLATNSPPQADSGGPYAGSEGEPLQLAPVLSDPEGDAITVLWEVDSPDCSFDDPQLPAAWLTCGDNGVYTLWLTATDAWEAQVVVTGDVTIANMPPVVESIVLAGVGAVNTVTIEAVFSDPGYADTHTALVRWGDGSESAGTVDGASQTVTATHTYATGGMYPVTVVVTDEDGASGELTSDIETMFKLRLPIVRRP